jgi:amino-acid N-acetyltransferase
MTVRKAAMRDIPALLQLINGYAAEGIMLPRTAFEIAENVRDFTVVEDGGRLLGCGALHFYTPASGEVRSVAVDPAAKNRGVGRLLVGALESEARECGLQTVFAFTYVPVFFQKLGYVEIDRSQLPLKAWKDCMRCPKFQCCDELAMRKDLDVPAGGAREVVSAADSPESRLIQLPVIKP